MTKLELITVAVSIVYAFFMLLYVLPHMIETERRRYHRRN